MPDESGSGAPKEQVLSLDLPRRRYAIARYDPDTNTLELECGVWSPQRSRPSRKRGSVQRLVLEGAEVASLFAFLASLNL